MTVRIGVDLGGTKIEAVAMDHGASAAPKELARARVPTNRLLGYEHIVASVRDVVFEVGKQAGVDPCTTLIGVGMPGSVTRIRRDGTRSDVDLVKNANTTCLNGRPFHSDLEAAIGRSIAFANDANCFALAEATWGAARGAKVTFGVIMGTGVGGGIVFTDPSGRATVWNGAQGIAGEWGHVVLDPERGPDCYCGRRGCIETYLSGPAIEAAYAARAGLSFALSDVAFAATHGDEVARALLEARVEIFGRALATVINVLDPDVVVLGGGVSKLDIWCDAGARAVARWIFNDTMATKIVQHELGDSAGVLGAALLPMSA